MKKNASSKNLLPKSVIILLISLLGFLGVPLVLLAQDSTPEPPPGTDEEPPAASAATIIRLVNPAEGSLVIGKKPEIRFVLLEPGTIQGIVVMLDGTDITNVLKQEGEEYSFKPITALSSGQHTLQISAKTNDDQELSQEAAFSSRQTEQFEEAYSENEIGLVYKRRLAKSDYIETEVKDRFDANLSSTSKLKEGNFETSLTTNMRYIDQDLPVTDPERKGVNLANFLWQTKYTKDKFSTGSDVGDLQIDETPLTLQGLARRGGRLNLAYDNFEAHGFVVKSKELFGFNGGPGIEGPTNEHILGTGASAKFFDEALLFKGAYVTGGEKENSYGTWTEPSQKRGHVSSLSTEIAFFDKKLLIDAEYAKSRFDGDTTDTYDAEEDKAYSYGLSGVFGIFAWRAGYQYIGPQYFVIGNSSLQNDQDGYNLEETTSFKTQTLTLGFSQYHDNVEDDLLLPRVETTATKAGYTFNGIQNLTVGLNYDHSLQESSEDLSGITSVKVYTDTYSGSLAYLIGKWNLQFQASHSVQDDRSADDNDSETDTYTFTPALTLDSLTVTPSYSYNTSWVRTTDVTTDTYTTGLNFSGHFFEERLLYEFAGTHNSTETSDKSTENYSLTATYKVSYVLAKEFWGFANPSLGIEGRYGSTHDYIADTRSHEKVVFLVFSSNLPFSF